MQYNAIFCSSWYYEVLWQIKPRRHSMNAWNTIIICKRRHLRNVWNIHAMY